MCSLECVVLIQQAALTITLLALVAKRFTTSGMLVHPPCTRTILHYTRLAKFARHATRVACYRFEEASAWPGMQQLALNAREEPELRSTLF